VRAPEAGRYRGGVPLDDFAAVDAASERDGGADHLVAMMHATDAWPAVRELREWVLTITGVGPASRVLDVGSGPGTFSRLATGRGARTVDVDFSAAMLDEVRRVRPGAPVVRAAIGQLPFRPFRAPTLVRVERVLQWADEPGAALRELWRIVPQGGWLAVTDTDWGHFTVEHDDHALSARIAAAAGSWVRQPRLATELPARIWHLGAAGVEHRTDVVVIDQWDPDDPAQHAGPPGLPLRSIAPDRPDDVDALAAAARAGRFRATLDLVTVVGRR